jgi:cytochrome c
MRTIVFLATIVLFSGNARAQMNPAFAPCAACHAVKPGQNRLGPSLFGIVGAKKAGVAGFAYSPAMKAQKGAWTEGELDDYIANPRAKVPGTRMIYAGMPDAAKRKALIGWLKTQR